MKKLLIIFFMIATAVSFAQIESFDSTYINELKQNVKDGMKHLVKDNLTLTESEAKVFWPLFDEYIGEYDKVAMQRTAITQDYMMDYYAMDDAKAKELIDKSMKLQEDLNGLKKTYYKKMLDKLPAKVAGKFFQIDTRATALVDLVRMSSIPLVRTTD